MYSLVLDLSNQSRRIGWLKQPEYQAYINMWSVSISAMTKRVI